MKNGFEKIDQYRYRLPLSGRMKVPGLVYLTAEMLAAGDDERWPEQLAGVASLPGLVSAALAMPDVHQGYGAPIGTVAAFDPRTGVVVPGITGYDINCGVRLMRTNLTRAHLGDRLGRLLDELYQAVPAGLGAGGFLKLSRAEMERVLAEGAGWAFRKGFGGSEERLVLEARGCYREAAPDKVSDEACARGSEQLGTLGSGNHFLEIQEVTRIGDRDAAKAFRLFKGQLVVMIHTGSRALGHQVAGDYLARFARRFDAGRVPPPPDRELVYAPASSDDGRDWLGAMAAAANFACANRQVISFQVGEVFRCQLGMSLDELAMATVYDASHNIIRLEDHVYQKRKKRLLVHRKGAIRCFPAGRVEVPVLYAGFGHPVLLPGSMGTCSHVLVGLDRALEETWGSTAHGAGRVLSRHAARRRAGKESLVRRLAGRGITVRTGNERALAEESPEAYKDVNEVVAVVAGAGLARPVAVLRPVAVIKG